MENLNKNTANIFTKSQRKDKHFKAQLLKVYDAFMDKPMTMLEADNYTGIMRSNICWYINHLKEQGRIVLIKKRKCSVTGFEAGEYTANKNLFPKINKTQLKFDF
jgi:hypothetical protein